jgi:hypothetical protein
MKEALKLAFQYSKENGAVTPDSCVKNEYVGNMWLRGLRKCLESLCLRKPEATLKLTVSLNLQPLIVKM